VHSKKAMKKRANMRRSKKSPLAKINIEKTMKKMDAIIAMMM